MIKVLIVDDSAFMRNALSNMLTSDHGIVIVGTARDGYEAIEKVQSLKPDVVTMDVEMPKMDGITALKRIMETNPVPVIMVSSLTNEGAQETLHALELGAVDFIPKNLSDLSVNILRLKEILIEKVKHIGMKGIPRRWSAAGKPASITEVVRHILPERATGERKVTLVAIGTSTGGPKALTDIIPRIPKDFPVPIVIAQHMPASFTKPFAERLNQLSAITVKEAEEGEPVRPGVALVAPGWGHMRLTRRRAIETIVTISEDRDEYLYRPSVDALTRSVAEFYPGRALGVMLTGMGNDGLQGLTAMKKGGSRIFAQNEETCVVYGMPRAVVEAGIADKVLAIEEMAGEIVNAV